MLGGWEAGMLWGLLAIWAWPFKGSGLNVQG